MLLLLDIDSSESESSSTDTSDSSDSDSDTKACAYEREFNKLFRIPSKKPKVVGFIEDVVRQYAANQTCMRDVASRLDMSESTVYRVLQRVVQFLMTLGPSVIKFPADLENLTSSFEKVSGMPAVIGCIDGSYVKIQCPDNKVASTYCNRHHYLSLTLQAVCDHKRRFLDAFTGTSSKMHDSRVFSLSPLSKNIASVCQGRYHILGDAAYPLREYLLTPYRDYGAMNKQQKGFNFKFSGTRVLIENAFSTLKKRFRQLMYLELHTIHWLNKFIISCCILHNLGIDYGD
nr:protein ANTAGONIST OF LIKE HETEROCHROMATIN PROTEIN 1-like [Rhipicephalus microplus]